MKNLKLFIDDDIEISSEDKNSYLHILYFEDDNHKLLILSNENDYKYFLIEEDNYNILDNIKNNQIFLDLYKFKKLKEKKIKFFQSYFDDIFEYINIPSFWPLYRYNEKDLELREKYKDKRIKL